MRLVSNLTEMSRMNFIPDPLPLLHILINFGTLTYSSNYEFQNNHQADYNFNNSSNWRIPDSYRTNSRYLFHSYLSC